MSCTDHSQRTFGFLLGTVTFLLLPGDTNALDGEHGFAPRLFEPTWTVLTSGTGISPVCSTRVLTLTVNETSCLNSGYKGQLQSRRAFIKSASLSIAWSRALHAHIAFHLPGTASLPSDTYVSRWNFFSQPRALEQHCCVSNK